MEKQQTASLCDVQAVYGGPEGKLWELLMGEQIHIGGLTSSMDLAQKAAIQPGSRGVDFCCCTGAGMRFLVRFCGVAAITGVDATEAMVELGKKRCLDEGSADRIQFVLADVCKSGLKSAIADFVWGEDAWCYVEDKPAMIAEACRIVRPGGTIAFTDWVLGDVPMTPDEIQRTLTFMKFPNLQSLSGYAALLEQHGCTVTHTEDTGRFADHVDLYLKMVGMQLTYDALKIIGYDQAMLKAIGEEMTAMHTLAREGKIIQGLFVARKK
jgi:ubiquinone/menaquinone biosynthesis C-methylase UbiE